MKSHADIILDTEGKILNVCTHRFTTRRHDRAVGDLLATLNETETPYPGTDMKLVYSLTGQDRNRISSENGPLQFPIGHVC